MLYKCHEYENELFGGRSLGFYISFTKGFQFRNNRTLGMIHNTLYRVKVLIFIIFIRLKILDACFDCSSLLF